MFSLRAFPCVLTNTVQQALGIKNTLKVLDLSNNLLGSHETKARSAKKTFEDMTTGASALALLLQTSRCSLETLHLSWNMIRLQSAVELGSSIKFNASLLHLDLAYNNISNDGGTALGDALNSHPCLRTLNLAGNNIGPRASFVIISGAQTCKSLQSLDLSVNPIGEVGAQYVMAVTVACGDSLSITVQNCSMSIYDKSCWFDPRKPVGTHKLNLSNAYDRAVCMELLRIAALNSDIKIESFKITEALSGSPQELKFDVHSIAKKEKEIDGKSDEEMDQILSSDVDRAKNIFRQFDEDGSGSLDRQELRQVLKMLGLNNSKAIIDQLLETYDIDGGGVIEEDEFAHFLSSMQQSAKKLKSMAYETRYMFLSPSSGGKAVAAGTAPHPYVPPDKGTVDVTIGMDSSVPAFLMTASQDNIETVLNATKALSDSNTMIEMALNSLCLKFDEAMMIYKIMMKETGDKFKVLEKLMPRMASKEDTHRLVSATSSSTLLERVKLKSHLGRLYNVYLGNPNGFYSLMLSDPQDKHCLERLIALDIQHSSDRKRLELGDTSQHGNWSSFRNGVYEGHAVVLDKTWFHSVPDKGLLEFDFVSQEIVSMTEQSFSDIRFAKVMMSLGLITDEIRGAVLARLSSLMDSGRAASVGVGKRQLETTMSTAEAIDACLDKLYASATTRGAPVDILSAQQEAEDAAMMAYEEDGQERKASGDDNSSSKGE